MSRDRLREAFLKLVAVALTVLSIATLAFDVKAGKVSLVNAIIAAAEFATALWLLDNAIAIRFIDFAIDRVQRLRGKP